ncbi:MAG: hypothetical protein AVDCRST_MAG26-3676 [uncultured Chloroflexia bacterium]|uniref:Calcineurin-like phosphoesterase domain-containing protein n=1 Tax=uncultured Chloroflexia bacterium TaxID=1672391 RepID=A0A6J4JQZ0_9CHLR|nr:MAG: hypothetical protein AVDCRST_MAG26-3676 [uncultured Chloroflexia bacterium]
MACYTGHMFRRLIFPALAVIILFSATPAPAPGATPSAVLMAAGDIACAPRDAVSSAACQQQATSDLIIANAPQAVLALGDLQYECGQLANFGAAFQSSWGRFKSNIYPVPGNREYNVEGDEAACPRSEPFPSGAAGYFTYFGAQAAPREDGCTVNCKGYYSFDLGGWHIIALNSNCAYIGGCEAGSPIEEWLRADLAASTAACTLAYMHHPRYSSDGGYDEVAPLWQALYEAGAEVVLAGHSHNYERFAPRDHGGNLDRARGVRQFVVGTGGKSISRFSSTSAHSEAKTDQGFGVLKLTLYPEGYDWSFLPVAPLTYKDSGSAACHARETRQIYLPVLPQR